MHRSYVERDTHGLLVEDGGRCYKEEDVRRELADSVQCKVCNKWLGDRWAYEAHFNACHLGREI